jgi:hypothetical protein
MGSDNKPDAAASTYSMNRILLKAKYSFYSALVFFLFANPETSHIFQRLFGQHLTFITGGGAPTIHGVFVQTLLFFLTMLGLMLLPSE